MNVGLKINASAFPDMLREPPQRLAHSGLLYAFLSVTINSRVYPSEFWCDFSGVLLLRWHREVRDLIECKTRYASLIFTDTPTEIWLRRTNRHYWQASCVTLEGGTQSIVAESLCLPEYVETSLHSASRQLLKCAREANVWYDDCQSLEEFLENRTPTLD